MWTSIGRTWCIAVGRPDTRHRGANCSCYRRAGRRCLRTCAETATGPACPPPFFSQSSGSRHTVARKEDKGRTGRTLAHEEATSVAIHRRAAVRWSLREDSSPPGARRRPERPAGSPVVDGFDRADAASLGVASTGQVWSNLAGGSAGVVGPGGAVSGYSTATIDGGGADGVVSVTLAEPSAESWLVLRVSDGANYWRFGRGSRFRTSSSRWRRNGLGSPAVDDISDGRPGCRDRIDRPLTTQGSMFGQRCGGGVDGGSVQRIGHQGRFAPGPPRSFAAALRRSGGR